MYTTLDLRELQYKARIVKEDYTVIKDIESFIQNLALGLIEVKEILTDKEFSLIDMKEILEIDSNIEITYVETLIQEANKNRNVVEDKVRNSVEKVTDEVGNKYSEEELIEVQHVNSKGDVDNVSTVVVENISNKIVLEDKEDKDNTIKNEEKDKTNLFSRMFKGKNKNKLTCAQVDLGSGLEDILKDDYTRGKFFKKMIVDEGHLTKEEVAYVEKKIEENKRVGVTKYFIQVCRETGLLEESKCAELLSRSTTTEIICKDVLETQMGLISKYNKELYAITDKYFIMNVDEIKNIVTICKDLIEDPNTYHLEQLYPGYEVETKNVIEGVTKEMHDLITLHQTR